MKTISGDLIHLAKSGDFDLIVHGCNCFCTMGPGIAKAIKAVFPAACDADLATAKGDRSKLGTCTFAVIDQNRTPLVVVNAYTQFDYQDRGPKVDYDAVGSCFRWISEQHSGTRIKLPKIVAGLAGGNWVRIAVIIEEELAGEDVTLVEFAP